MKVFRLQENAPDAYTRNSRDFQLMCNVFDCVNGAVKYDIDSIKYITDTSLCNDKLLNALQSKVGFFTNLKLTSTEQRVVIDGFPYVLKNKGSSLGIKQAIRLFLSSQGVFGKVSVVTTNKEIIKNEDRTININDVYTVTISSNQSIKSTKLLDEILKYIMPSGYLVKYSFMDTTTFEEVINNDNHIRIVFARDASNRSVRKSEDINAEINNDDNKLYGKVMIKPIAEVNTAKVASIQTINGANEDYDENHTYEEIRLWEDAADGGGYLNE